MSKEAEEMKMEALLRWAADVGISDAPLLDSDSSSCSLGRSLAVSYFPHDGGRGLAAASNLRMGDLVLRVPRAALLTRESVLQNEKVAFCIKKHPHLSSSQILTICLLAEVDKGKDSWWYPYLVLLPMNYNTLANFNEFEISALQVDDAIWVSEKTVLKARLDWKECLIVLQEMKLKPKLLSLRSWIWASATVSSRTLHIPWDDAGCLCPVGDLFNYAALDDPFVEDEQQLTEQPDFHADRLTDGGYEEDSASYCFYANKNYQKGEQVLLGYGTYSNLDLLEHYGFVLQSNPNDKAFLPPDMNINTSKSCSMKDSVYIQPDGKPSFALLCALRLWATPFNNRRAVGHLAYAGSFLSNENELLVMRKLAEYCSKALEELPTTAEHDASLLVIINKMLESGSHLGCLQLAFCLDEVVGFMRANGWHIESSADSLPTAKFMRSLERWRLSVNWSLPPPFVQVFLNPQPKLTSGMEQTFIMIKPDGVQRGLIGDVISRFEKKGFYLKGLKLLNVERSFAEKHYEDLSAKPFFPGLVEYIISGPVVAMVWEGKNVVVTGRKMIGATNPSNSEPGTIRGDFAIEVGRNVIHGSDSIESARKEIALWFPEGVSNWNSSLHAWIYE